MNRVLASLIFKGKATLCVLLMMHLCLWSAGCGQLGQMLPDGSLYVALTPDHPLAAQFDGTVFEGATAVIIHPDSHQFQVVFPDADRQFSGTYAITPAGPTITQLTMATGDESMTFTLDDVKAITSITSSRGANWVRPTDWAAPAVDANARGVDAYVQANQQLLDLAEQSDQEAGLTTGGSDQAATGSTSSPTKVADSSLAVLGAVALSFAAFWGMPLLLVGSILWVLQAFNFINWLLPP